MSATVGGWWRFWRTLPQNPVYQREKGAWGTPNPFYERVSRMSPFVVMGAIVLGACFGFNNPALFSGNDELAVVYCLLCLPGFLLSSLTLYGTFMAPALTAPSISMELNGGTWDMLRLTPQPLHTLLLAKLFGGLARMRIWVVLLALSLLQGLATAVLSLAGGPNFALWGVLIGLMAFLKPWSEILFAALAGLYASIRASSERAALVGSYAAVVLMKLFVNTAVFGGVTSALGAEEWVPVVAAAAGPTLVYLLVDLSLMAGISRWAANLA